MIGEISAEKPAETVCDNMPTVTIRFDRLPNFHKDPKIPRNDVSEAHSVISQTVDFILIVAEISELPLLIPKMRMLGFCFIDLFELYMTADLASYVLPDVALPTQNEDVTAIIRVEMLPSPTLQLIILSENQKDRSLTD